MFIVEGKIAVFKEDQMGEMEQLTVLEKELSQDVRQLEDRIAKPEYSAGPGQTKFPSTSHEFWTEPHSSRLIPEVEDFQVLLMRLGFRNLWLDMGMDKIGTLYIIRYFYNCAKNTA